LLRTYMLAAALLALTVPPAGAESRASSWSSERMRLTPPPEARPGVRRQSPPRPRYRAPPFHDELSGNCVGLTVMTKTRIEWLKTLQDKAGQQRWPPPSPMAQWEKRPADGDIARQREQIARLNTALGAKGCQPVDIDAELQRAPASGAKAGSK
jgi:hypothetical protein